MRTAGANRSLRSPARLDSLSVEDDRVSGRLSLGKEHHDLTYRVAGVPLVRRYEPFLVAALPIAMRAASTLSVPDSVSPRLLDSLPTIQRILSAWSDPLRPVEVEAPHGTPEPDGERGTASFFSGGVDSFYTALRNLDQIDALVYVHGFDVSLHNRHLREQMSRSLHDTAADLGRPLIEIEANLRDTADRYWGWDFYHGALLASAGLLLAPSFQRILIPASHSYTQLFPWGSHPVLDPLWSTEAVELVHEGVAARMDKVFEISRSDVAMGRLHVCWSEDTEGNCGRCGKCLRTMASLEIAGALQRCDTLPDHVPLRALSRTRIRHESVLGFLEENLHAAEARGTDPALTRALRRAVLRGSLYLGIRPRGSRRFARLWKRVGRAERRLRRFRRERS